MTTRATKAGVAANVNYTNTKCLECKWLLPCPPSVQRHRDGETRVLSCSTPQHMMADALTIEQIESACAKGQRPPGCTAFTTALACANCLIKIRPYGLHSTPHSLPHNGVLCGFCWENMKQNGFLRSGSHGNILEVLMLPDGSSRFVPPGYTPTQAKIQEWMAEETRRRAEYGRH